MKAAMTLILALGFAGHSWAQSGDKIDIQNLEQKYWAAKDDDFSVIQNRKYAKAKRFHVSYFLGTLVNDPFAVGYPQALQVGYYLNERWGFDLAYQTADMSQNQSNSQFISQYGTAPNHGFFKNSTIASVNFVPLYAKMSWMDRSIIYFDTGVSLGLGTLTYSQQNNIGTLVSPIYTSTDKSTAVLSLGVHQQVFVSEKLAFKLEILNYFSNQEQVKYTDITEKLGSKSINDTIFRIGITYWH